MSPYYVQSKDIAWLYLKHYCSPFLEHGLKTNEAELSVVLPHNNATIKLYGAENAERMRGLYQDGIAIDEAQGIKKQVLTSIILPSLADRKGWLDVSGTPKGWENLLGELVIMARADPDNFFLQILKASETGLIAKDELDRLKKLMPENEYAQEFECDFDAAITGSVYGKWIAEIEAKGRMVNGLYNPDLEVNTAWDLGLSDSTVIWWWQIVGNEVRLIDYYESHGHGIAHYCEIIKGKQYKYGNHYVPHDAAHKLLAAGGRSIVNQARDLGINMRVVASTSQQNGINALRKVLENTWIDPVTCKDGVGALKQYQFEFDDNKNTYRDTPRKDWSSHACDAAEIIGQVMREKTAPQDKPKPKFFENLTAYEVFWGGDDNTSKYGRI